MHDVPNIVVTHCGFQWQAWLLGVIVGFVWGFQTSYWLVKPNVLRKVKPGGEHGDNRLNDESRNPGS